MSSNIVTLSVVDRISSSVVCGCFVAVCVVGLVVIGSLLDAILVVGSVGFLVGKRVASVNPVDKLSGFDVVLEIVCDAVVNSGNTLGMRIHSGGYSVLTRIENKHVS